MTTLLSLATMFILKGRDLFAEESTEPHTESSGAEAQANNPLANMTAFNIQNYYISEFTGTERGGNQFLLRYAQPVPIGETNWLVRATLPVNTFPFNPDGSRETGLGDFNVFAAYLFDMPNPALSFGFGPLISAPSATDEILGTEKWSSGFANVLFDGRSKHFQWGYLATWNWSFAGTSNRDDVNAGAFQPFAFYQLGGGNYLRSSAVMPFNVENGDYSIPLGIGFGHVIPKGKTVYNIFLEPQYSIADDGTTLPEWQFFLGFNIQFLN